MANRWHETNGRTWDGNERGRKLNDFLQLTLNGLAVGCIYGLVALGFVLIYKATELVNFAQGDLLMLGAFVCYMAVVWWGWADLSGYTQRKAMERHEAKRADRRERNAQALGLKLDTKRRPR